MSGLELRVEGRNLDEAMRDNSHHELDHENHLIGACVQATGGLTFTEIQGGCTFTVKEKYCGFMNVLL